ncbi:hypothetical protein ACWEWQ_09935, partial [Streptomyces sp. NPDC003832]
MAIDLGGPGTEGPSGIVGLLREWQHDGAPWQLHPGDLGWHWRFGARATAAALRTWSRDGRILAVGLLDEPGLLRLTTAPDARRDEELARRVAADLSATQGGVFAGPEAAAEVPFAPPRPTHRRPPPRLATTTHPAGMPRSR